MFCLRSPLPQFAPEESWWQTAWMDEDSGSLFKNVGGNRKLIWTLKRILIFPKTHTFHTQCSSVPQGPSMMTCIYFLILLFLYRLAQTEKKKSFPTCKWSDIASNAIGQAATQVESSTYSQNMNPSDLHSRDKSWSAIRMSQVVFVITCFSLQFRITMAETHFTIKISNNLENEGRDSLAHQGQTPDLGQVFFVFS